VSTGDLERPNLVRLRVVGPSPADERARQAAQAVRRQLSLLQGYADIMEGLSADLRLQILRVMAVKTQELSVALQPFLATDRGGRPPIGAYRDVRNRTRQLITEYRTLLAELHETVSSTPESKSAKG
jgi:hypothetical protein